MINTFFFVIKLSNIFLFDLIIPILDFDTSSIYLSILLTLQLHPPTDQKKSNSDPAPTSSSSPPAHLNKHGNSTNDVGVFCTNYVRDMTGN